MKPRTFIATALALLVGLPLLAVSVWFSSVPSSADHNGSYYVEATGYDSYGLDIYVWKNSSYFVGNSNYGLLSVGGWTSDSGPQTVEYIAEGYGWQWGDDAWDYAYVSINAPPNQAPFGVRDYHHPSVSQNGNLHASGWATDNEMGAPVTRVDILIDGNDVGDANLNGYRPDVANAYGRSDFTYSGWAFDYGVGWLSTGTHSLELRAWDSQGASAAFGYTTFEVTNHSPGITLLSPSAQTIGSGTTLSISSTATDADGNLTHHNLDIQKPDGSWNWYGGFAYGEPYMGGPVGSAANSTRTANFTFDIPGTWYVRSWVNDANGNNLHSATVAITITDTTPPSVPTGLVSSNVTDTSFTLSWSASTDNVGVTGYEVFRGGVSQGTTASTSMSITGLSPGTTHPMTVRARDAAPNWSAQSAALNVTTTADTTAPSVPTGLSSTSVTSGSFTLNWSASTDNIAVTGYEVFKGGVSCGTTASTSMNITGLLQNTTYAMTVRARDAAPNWSAQSSALNVTTAVNPATDTDSDGVPDYIEQQMGTSPAVARQSDTANTAALKIHKPN